ncbi:CAP domain-containing protein [Intestinibacter bartlettii]|uniref:CAP domain-containing protein n=2 Tax=Intestinibacter bartlettii TaxID=261299 RepID=UPI001D010512|nr:CAP domain-containing protein [Intestinibacter bartlettii]MDU1252730.1 CAP domain-containing protein [Peptostreptococcaceae bacterium]MDU5919750.1 CAP domain-containing protein [Clostridiales bacterium]MCB5745246.1 CAP domain-containing protein [Intestinibacter bartlettii]MDU4257194.1 CAP domain-containing protein [Intestinibacter bartlettii]MDU6197296.1 CAP domain-containing protein [Intestinibacter bartlettii]
MNKKLKRMAVVGATVLMTASSVGFSNAMQVKKSCDLNLKGKMYVCINGKRFKLDLSCASIFDTLKWFNKNNCPNKFPSINDDKDDNIEDNNQNNGNNQDNNNQGGNMEDNNQGNNNQDKDDNNPGNDNNQDQDKDDNNQDNNNNQDQDKDDNNQDNNNNQDQDDNNQNDDNNSSNINGFSKEQVEVLNLVNKERKANGLKPLTLNKELSNVANIKSRDMIEKGYFDHTSPTYGSPFDMMKKFNISYNTAGENIAMGQKTPSEVMNSWMNSSGHRANILNSTYTELGVGIQKDSNGTIYWTQMFIGR